MSLLQLLSVGRTWTAAGNETSRYKMTGQNVLPRFGRSEKSGLPASEPLGRGVLYQRPARQPMDQPPARSLAEPARVPGPKTIPVEQTQSVPKTLAPEKVARPAPQKKRPSFWRRLFTSSAAQPGRPLTQAELSLESVRVVRNDLSDADVELIRRAPKEASR